MKIKIAKQQKYKKCTKNKEFCKKQMIFLHHLLKNINFAKS